MRPQTVWKGPTAGQSLPENTTRDSKPEIAPFHMTPNGAFGLIAFCPYLHSTVPYTGYNSDFYNKLRLGLVSFLFIGSVPAMPRMVKLQLDSEKCPLGLEYFPPSLSVIV